MGQLASTKRPVAAVIGGVELEPGHRRPPPAGGAHRDAVCDRAREGIGATGSGKALGAAAGLRHPAARPRRRRSGGRACAEPRTGSACSAWQTRSAPSGTSTSWTRGTACERVRQRRDAGSRQRGGLPSSPGRVRVGRRLRLGEPGQLRPARPGPVDRAARRSGPMCTTGTARATSTATSSRPRYLFLSDGALDDAVGFAAHLARNRALVVVTHGRRGATAVLPGHDPLFVPALPSERSTERRR